MKEQWWLSVVGDPLLVVANFNGQLTTDDRQLTTEGPFFASRVRATKP